MLHNVRPNPDINEVSSYIEITTEHTEAPKSIYDLVVEYKLLNSNWEEYGHVFVSFLKLEKSQAAYICEQPKSKVAVTASIFHQVVSSFKNIWN